MALGESINDLEIKDEEEECCICFESLENSTVLTLKCKHKLHSRCGLDWFLTEKKDSCPLCRAELDDVTPTPISAPEPAVPIAPAPSPPRIMSVNGSIMVSNFSSSQTVMLAGNLAGLEGLAGPPGFDNIAGPVGVTGVVGTAGPVGYTGAVGVTGSFGYTGAVGPASPSSSTFSWVPGPQGYEEYAQPARFYPKKKCYSSSDSSSDSDSDHGRRRRRNKSHTSRRGCYQKSSSDSSSDSDSDRCQYKNYTMCKRCDRC